MEPETESVRCYSELTKLLTDSGCYFDALIERDRLKILSAEGKLTVSQLEVVSICDSRLKAASKNLERADLKKKSQLRAVIAPDDAAWWWNPDPQYGWQIAAAILFAISATLVTTFATKTLTENPDVWGVFAVAAQAVLTLATGATFTLAGKRWLDALARWSGFDGHMPQVSTGVALCLLVTTGLCWHYVPDAIASRYNMQALAMCPANQVCNDIPNAIRLFRRAASLPNESPTASRVHYNFGRVYELAHDYDNAIEQYQMAIQEDPDSPSALNNWAWLLLLKGTQTNVALSLLDEAALRVDARSSDDVPYAAAPAVYKNRGLANLRLGFLDLAEGDLRKSISLQGKLQPPDTAAAHCVLAAVLEKAERRLEAITEAEVCARLSRLDRQDQGSPKTDPESFRVATKLARSEERQ